MYPKIALKIKAFHFFSAGRLCDRNPKSFALVEAKFSLDIA